MIFPDMFLHGQADLQKRREKDDGTIEIQRRESTTVLSTSALDGSKIYSQNKRGQVWIPILVHIFLKLKENT